MLPAAAIIASDPAATFTSLPPEIRTKIYRIAFRSLLTTLHPPSHAHRVSRPRYLGALALLQTNRAIREECARELIPIIHFHCKGLDIYIRKLEATISVSDASTSSPPRVQQRERKEAEIKRAEMREVSLGNVKSVLWRVVLASPVVD